MASITQFSTTEDGEVSASFRDSFRPDERCIRITLGGSDVVIGLKTVEAVKLIGDLSAAILEAKTAAAKAKAEGVE